MSILSSKFLQPRTISAKLPASELAKAMDDGTNHGGVILLKDLPVAPLDEIREALEGLSKRPDLSERLNKAYTKNLVHKDSFAMGKGGPSVDMKRVLDLSPERLETIRSNDPDLALLEEGSLANCLRYWEDLRTRVAPKIVEALALAVGSEDVVTDASYNYRMVDYYERQHVQNNPEDAMVAPRCGEHRDFGSFTLVFPSHSGLQVFDNPSGEWKELPAIPEGTAILLFGWCTQIRSNGRIPAALHRVTDSAGVDRRTSAVLFCAPKQEDSPLEPVVRPGEERVYISGIRAGQLRGKMRLKWQKREGTLSEAGKILEEKEILATNLLTQDDVVDTMRINTMVAAAK